MVEQQKKPRKAARSETVSVRLEPKLRYLAELAARRQRRTLSSFIDWAVEDALSRVYLDFANNSTVADQGNGLWDVDPADRLAKLALRFEHLLTHEEQVLWKLIKENGYLWKGHRVRGEWTWNVTEESLIFPRLREHWASFTFVARGDASPDILPTWVKNKPEPEAAPF